MKAPEASVLIVDGAVVATIPPIWMIADALAVKPLPMICMVEPVAPVSGVRLRTGGVKVKVALAVFPLTSVTVTVFVEVAVIGTVKDDVTAPPAVVVPVAAVTPLTFTVNAADGPKPVPAMLTMDPLMIGVPRPPAGVNVIAEPIVIVVVANLVPSLTCTVYVPAVMPAGTRNHVVKS